MASALDAMVVTDPDGLGKVLSVNPAACSVFGYTEQEFLQINRATMFDLDDPNLPALLEQKEQASQATAELTYRCKDGSRFAGELSTALFRDRNGERRTVSIIRDIIERKQAEQRIIQLNRELERQAAELELVNKELEAFSYSVSHDLRTPLASIDGLSRHLRDEYGPNLPEHGQRVLALIHESTMSMNRLIEDLLALAQSARQAFQELASAQTDRQVDFRIGDLPSAQADPVLLKQVWVNLLSNALKFTRGRAVAQIEIGAARQGEETVYFVRDNGAGFDVTHADKLFGVFRRLHTEDEYEGTGVGLAIVERIIHRHGGRVWAEAAVDQGATFYFTLSP